MKQTQKQTTKKNYQGTKTVTPLDINGERLSENSQERYGTKTIVKAPITIVRSSSGLDESLSENIYDVWNTPYRLNFPEEATKDERKDIRSYAKERALGHELVEGDTFSRIERISHQDNSRTVLHSCDLAFPNMTRHYPDYLELMDNKEGF